MARPRGGDWLEDEIAHWRDEGIGVVVSLLESEEVNDLRLEREEAYCRQRDIEFLSFPIADRQIPSDPIAALSLASALTQKLVPVAIHCRAGIGRSTIIAASVLVAAGVDPARALKLIGAARGLTVPDTEQQREWVLRLG